MDFLNQTSVKEMGHQATVIAISDDNVTAPDAVFANLRVVTVLAIAIPLVVLFYRLLIDRKLVS